MQWTLNELKSTGLMSVWNAYDAIMCMRDMAVKFLKRFIKN